MPDRPERILPRGSIAVFHFRACGAFVAASFHHRGTLRLMRSLPLFVLALLWGCRSPSPPSVVDAGTAAPPPPTAEVESPFSPAPSVAPEVVAKAARDASRFGIAVYRAHAADNDRENIVLSPVGASTAFALAYPGARNKSAAVLEKVFGFEAPASDALGAHSVLLAKGEQGCSIEAATAAFHGRGLHVRTEYADLLAASAVAELSEVDFENPDRARGTINDWMSDRTRGRIAELIPRGGIDSRTRLALTSAAYFNGTWAQRFDPRQTREDVFHGWGGDRVVPFMGHAGIYRFAALESAEVVELPYRCGNWVMLLILPWKGASALKPWAGSGETGLGLAGLSQRPPRDAGVQKAAPAKPPLSSGLAQTILEHDLSVEFFDEVDRALSPRMLWLRVPRFDLSMSLPLSGLLKGPLGAAHLFTQDADFSGITQEKPFFIQQAFHSAQLRADEEGTEAAAGSAVVFGSRGARSTPDQFTLDRPFLFAVRDGSTGAILFLGRVSAPSR